MLKTLPVRKMCWIDLGQLAAEEAGVLQVVVDRPFIGVVSDLGKYVSMLGRCSTVGISQSRFSSQ